ncbi:hypothetical protein GC176_28340 [bacterium]|nr:hypothetical protein [bacterium]
MERTVRATRPQLVCVLADNSGSMRGAKAEAATRGIREMLMKCQMKGPPGRDRSYFRFVLIQFGSHAAIDEASYMKPVREIDPDSIEIRGDGGGTNITEALEKVCAGLERYLHEVVEPHPERDRYPMPVVLLFSDGHNGGSCPLGVADRIRSLHIDGDHVLIAAASVAVAGSVPPDGNLLREIATPGCCISVDQPELLSEFLVQVGSSAAVSAQELARIAAPLDRPRLEGPAPAVLSGPVQDSADNGSGGRRGSDSGRHNGRRHGGKRRHRNTSNHVIVQPSQPVGGEAYGLGD